MKSILLFLSLMIPALAFADYPTVTPLAAPVLSRPASCAPAAFTEGGITGACRTVLPSVCSGRGCQPVLTTTLYVTTWDMAGNVTFNEACSTIRHHAPQPDQVTYLNGHTSCAAPVWDTGVTVGVPYGPYAWDVTYYYYVTSNGVAELVADQTTGYVVTE
jgi:hypothetical protein